MFTSGQHRMHKMSRSNFNFIWCTLIKLFERVLDSLMPSKTDEFTKTIGGTAGPMPPVAMDVYRMAIGVHPGPSPCQFKGVRPVAWSMAFDMAITRMVKHRQNHRTMVVTSFRCQHHHNHCHDHACRSSPPHTHRRCPCHHQTVFTTMSIIFTFTALTP